MASGAIHSNRIHNTGIRFFCIEMGRPWRNRANGHLESLRGLTHFDEGLLPWLAMRLYREFRAEDEVAPLAIEGLVLELLAGVARQSSHSEKGTTRWMQKARDFVHDRFQESISLAEVADFAEVHPVSLARAFRRTYHCTVGDYVRKLRIEFACQKLTGSFSTMAMKGNIVLEDVAAYVCGPLPTLNLFEQPSTSAISPLRQGPTCPTRQAGASAAFSSSGLRCRVV